MKFEVYSSAADPLSKLANAIKPNLCTVCLWLFSVEDHMIIYPLLNFVLYSLHMLMSIIQAVLMFWHFFSFFFSFLGQANLFRNWIFNMMPRIQYKL